MRSISALPTPILVLLSAFALPSTCTDGDSGLIIETTELVTCSRPTKNGDKISVHYRGTLQSTGVEFDDSYNRGVPIILTLGAGQVIRGWEEGLLDMCPGEGRKLIIPPDLAYGAAGRPPVIPGDSTLVFDTELVDIVGVKQESLTLAPTSQAATASGEVEFTIATAPPTPLAEDDKAEEEEPTPTLEATPLSPSHLSETAAEQGECHLLGPFALIVQGALGLAALLTLVYKRWRETSKRPWMIWFFDVSKQVVGSILTHILNLAMSMLGSVDMVNAAAKAVSATNKGEGGGKKLPNPCSFYLLNLGIDVSCTALRSRPTDRTTDVSQTTLGIPILWMLLKVLHAAFYYTPLAKPPQSIKSGHYGQPPKWTWWLKQSLIYFIGLTGMKLFVFFLFAALPWLPWVGDWALRWTEGNEALQIAFAMFIFPLMMNGLQYWIIDNFIMDKQRGKENAQSYQQVQGHDDDETEHDGDDSFTEVEEDVHGKDSDDASMAPPLKEVSPSPISEYLEGPRKNGEGSGTASPRAGNQVNEVQDLERN